MTSSLKSPGFFLPMSGWIEQAVAQAQDGLLQVLVANVRDVAGLEGDDGLPALVLEDLAGLGREEVVGGVGPAVVVDEVDGAADEVVAALEEAAHAGVLGLGGAEDGLRGLLLVPRVDFADMVDRQGAVVALLVEGDVADGDAVLRRDVEHDGDGPERAVGQPVAGDDAVEVGLADEALAGREDAAGDVLRIARGVEVHNQLRQRSGPWPAPLPARRPASTRSTSFPPCGSIIGTASW